MNIDQVKKLAYDLRLFGVYDACESRTAEAAASALSPAELLLLLLKDEQNQRKSAQSKRLVSRAQFRYEADLEDWDSSFDRGIAKARLKELASLGFYKRKDNLLIYGKTGEGKTQLAISIGRRLCHDGVATTFYSTNMLFEEIQAERAAGNYLAFVRKLVKTSVIVLDDFGLRRYTHEEATTLLDILEDRYRKGSIIVTSQVDAKGWRSLFDDPVIAEAIVDRLANPSQVITLKGGSYRERLGDKGLPN